MTTSSLHQVKFLNGKTGTRMDALVNLPFLVMFDLTFGSD